MCNFEWFNFYSMDLMLRFCQMIYRVLLSFLFHLIASWKGSFLKISFEEVFVLLEWHCACLVFVLEQQGQVRMSGSCLMKRATFDSSNSCWSRRTGKWANFDTWVWLFFPFIQSGHLMICPLKFYVCPSCLHTIGIPLDRSTIL